MVERWKNIDLRCADVRCAGVRWADARCEDVKRAYVKCEDILSGALF
jgi:hypothetical protein